MVEDFLAARAVPGIEEASPYRSTVRLAHGPAIVAIDSVVAAHRIDLARSWFYTDSITDLPLLELVGHPVVTNPDPRLYREAARRRWPVRFFTPPELAAGGPES